MFKQANRSDLAALILRLGLAAIFLVRGGIKVIYGAGEWAGEDLTANVQAAVAWGEVLVGGALLIGLFSRLAAVGAIVIMVGAIILVTGRLDFVRLGMVGSQQEGIGPSLRVGYEYNVTIIVMSLAILLLGSGLFSVDALLRRRKAAAVAQEAPAEPALPRA